MKREYMTQPFKRDKLVPEFMRYHRGWRDNWRAIETTLNMVRAEVMNDSGYDPYNTWRYWG